MFTEARIAAGLDAMLRQIDVPPVPLAQIRERGSRKRFAWRKRERILWPAAAAAAALLLVFAAPTVAPGFVQSVEAQIEALLRWKLPPPAPKSVWSAMRPVEVTLAAARSRVPFTLVLPTGLPPDVVSREIYLASPGVYSKATRSWSVGEPMTTFVYRRENGTSFSLRANRFDALAEPPSKYIFEDMDRMRNGHEVIVRHNVFTWRNGDQAMGAVEGEGISATEIVAIRTAMHGIPIAGVYRPPGQGSTETQFRIPGP
jgi:hypothetical protein